MKTESWQQADRILVEALQLPEDRRLTFLDAACGGDRALRDRLERLVANEADLDDFLENPVAATDIGKLLGAEPRSADLVAAGPPPGAIGEHVGPYRLMDRLGTGGMGTVYLAEQRQPVERQVALKLIKPGMDSSQVLARFAGERQALALMNHTNVATAYDAGCTESGRLYFAMEYVPGREITAYCDRFALGFRRRVELFLQVCDGVQHAHQKGVIHRDLKPGNLLVRHSQGEPATVKIIDFGVAKSLQRKLSEHTVHTRVGSFVGTLTYSSPEQIAGRFVDTDTRSDVYSLGVVLYELLVGAAPYGEEDFSGKDQLEIARMLCEQDPPTPADRFTSLKRDPETVAQRRSLSAEQMRQRLNSDVSWIVLRCLERLPADRYASVLELRKDLERWLDDRPIEARPATRLYRLRKLVRRHRSAVTMAALATIALLATTTMAVVEFVRAERAAAEARHAALEAEMASEFQVEQLQAIDPASMGGSLRAGLQEEVKRRLAERGWEKAAIAAGELELEVLLQGVNFTDLTLSLLDQYFFERALAVIETHYHELPLLQARLYQTVADTLRELGRLEDAVEPQEHALEQRRRALGREHPLALASLRGRGRLRKEIGHYEGAAADLREALEVSRRVLGDEHPDTLRSIGLMGTLALERGHLSEAESHLREALRGRRRVSGDDHRETLLAISDLGNLFEAQGKPAEAVARSREALAGLRQVLGNEHPDTLIEINNLGVYLLGQGKLAEAEPYYREALAANRRVLGNEHPRTLALIGNMGTLLVHRGKLEEAEPLLREALAVRRRVLGDEHPDTLNAIHNMGGFLSRRGSLTEAATHCREALELGRRVLGDEHPRTLASMHLLGSVLRDLGQLDEALALGRQATETARRVTSGHYTVGLLATSYGRTLTALGRFEEAKATLEEALAVLSAAGDAGAPHLARPVQAFIELHDAWHATEPDQGHDAEVDRWQHHLDGMQSSE